MSEKPTSSRRLATRIALLFVDMAGRLPERTFQVRAFYDRTGWKLRKLPGSCVEQPCIDGHSGDGVHAHRVQGIDFCAAADASSHNELASGEGAERAGGVRRETLQGAFGIDVSIEKRSAER